MTVNLNSQDYFTRQFTSLSLLPNADSHSMGESFVANSKASNAFLSNPATLSGIKGITFFYNNRELNYTNLYIEEFFVSSAGITASSSLGNFGFNYSRYEEIYGTLGGLGSNKFKDFNYTAALSYSYPIFDDLHFGVSLKMIDHGREHIQGETPKLTAKPAFLMDFGLLHSLPKLFYSGIIKDQLNLGLSLQNFGTKLDIEDKLKSFYFWHMYKIPRFLRMGYSYSVNISSSEDRSLFEFMTTGEYKKLLNPGIWEKGDTDFWGAGFEATFYEIISVRMGGHIYPDDLIIAEKEKPMFRFGAGLNLSGSLLGIDYPISVKVDYALSSLNANRHIRDMKRYLPVFSVGLNYQY